MHFYRKCWFDPSEEQFISPFLSDCPSLMLGIAIHCIQHSQAMLERGVCELAHSFFHCFSCFIVFSEFPKSKNLKWCTCIYNHQYMLHIFSLSMNTCSTSSSQTTIQSLHKLQMGGDCTFWLWFAMIAG